MSSATIVMNLTDESGNAIPGECTIEGYEERIELQSWSWSFGVGEAGLAFEPQNFAFSKLADRSSTVMMQKLSTSKVLQRAEILIEEDSLDSMIEVKITLRKVRIADLRFSMKSEDRSGEVSEDWSFTFEEADVQYRSRGDRAKREKPATNVFSITGGPWQDRAPSRGSSDSSEQIKEIFKQMSAGERKVLVDQLRNFKDVDLVKEKPSRTSVTSRGS